MPSTQDILAERVRVRHDRAERNREQRLRRLAKRHGLGLKKSRSSWPKPDDQLGYALLDPATNWLVHGWNFDLRLDDVEAWLADDDAIAAALTQRGASRPGRMPVRGPARGLSPEELRFLHAYLVAHAYEVADRPPAFVTLGDIAAARGVPSEELMRQLLQTICDAADGIRRVPLVLPDAVALAEEVVADTHA